MKKLLQIPKVLFGILVVALLGCTTLNAQSVQMISPNGGESWLGGSTRAITWTYTNVDNIRIEYSLDNGLTWQLLSSNYPASALGINWVVPAIGSNQCKVRITSVLFFTQDESNTTFTIPEPIVLLSYPMGGESFGTGTGQYIEWSTTDVANVVAQYSTNNGATWTDIGTFPAGNNYCNWVAPSTINSQTKIRVYNVENAINQATSPAVFAITNVPTIAPEKYRGGSNDGYKMASSLPDAITVTAPNGGETFYPTNAVNITWTFRNTDAVKIEYSLNNGSTWNLITASVAADTQTYPWSIPNSPSTQCLIKVSDLGSALSDVSNATFTINSAFVTVTYPNGGESFGEGTGQYIEWDFNAVATVLLEYSTNNGTTWTSIGTAPASNKYANWIAPAGANSQCLIRISDSSTPLVFDTTDATFAITTVAVTDVAKYRGGSYDGYSMAKNLPDNITVTSPNGGETWTGASTRTISWTYTNVDNVSVEFSLDDGITWTTLAANLPASQLSYSWTVPTTPSYICRVRVKDLISPVSDMNDTAFIIPNSWVQLKYPNGGESFGGGTGQYIEWDYSFIQTIKLEYSINNGTTWSVIGTANAADKYANWVAPLDVSSQILIRATDVNNALFTDTSDLVFSNFALPTIAPEKYRGGANDGYSMYSFKDIYINVLKPNGGEIWGNGTIKNIDFSTLNLPTADQLKIEYSIDNEAIWNTLATNIDKTASPYVWTIAASPSAIAKVRISNMDGTIFDKSDNFFTIANINGIVTNALGANSFCSGQSATVTFTKNTTFNAGNKFIVQLSDAQGTFSGALINIGEITSQVPAPITVTFPAVYTSSSLYRIRVIATDTPTIGTDNGTNFTIRPLPTVNLGGQATICSGTNLTLNATNTGSTYLWSTGATTPTISVNSAGTYQVAVTNSCGTTTDAIVVQVKNSPIVNLGPDATICLNSALQLSAGTTDATYLWSTGATNSSISVVTPGTYTATATNTCGSNTDSITITNLPQITVDLGPDAGLCAGKNIVLNAGNPGSTYLWSTGATTQSITVTTPGNYTVGVTNSCGTVSDQISIYNGSFNLNAGADQTICTGKSAVLNATGGNNYSWNTGATTSTITVSPTINTTYTVTATNIYGCTATDQVAVAVNPTVTPTFTTPAATCSGGTSPLQTTSNNGILGTWLPAFNNAATTTYTFTPTVGQCANTTTQTITISNPKVTSAISFVAPLASIGVLNVGSATITGTMTNGIAASGVNASIPYTGGNGISYAAQTISSTGVSGLTATLLSGVLANGDGSLLYTISGTPTASGTVSFTITIGGQSGTFTIPVAVNLVAKYPIGSVFCASGPTAIVDVTNPITGKTWMDRNLGASQTATSATDLNAHGDLYQWGRRADGHQCRNSTTTGVLSILDQPTNSSFVLASGASPYDWRNPQNHNLWQGVNGINNPCPSGYRVPTESELEAERASFSSLNSNDAFSSLLKFTISGYRNIDGSLKNVNSSGYYWSSTVTNSKSRFLMIGRDVSMQINNRSIGHSVRCIKQTIAIGSLNCENATVNGNVINGQIINNVSINLPYSSGNGDNYQAMTLNSTGVSGLIASISSGQFNNGSGNLTLVLSGTPAAIGEAFFDVNIGGQICSINVNVVSSSLVNLYPSSSIFCNGPTKVVEVLNPTTGKIWMDRNLGASQVASSSTDINSFGDLYQWGRKSDGHQCRSATTTSISSATDQAINGNFILSSISPYDWRSPQNINLWQGISGVNNPCPSGYRLPSQSELNSERLSWVTNTSVGAFSSPLKLPMAGTRDENTGLFFGLDTVASDTEGNYWSSNVSSNNSTFLNFYSGFASFYSVPRARGFSVRCIKN